MSRINYAFFIVMAYCLMACPTTAAAAAEYNVEINKGQLVRLSSAAASVVVADQAIADVQVVSPHLIYINGRSIGETSVIAIGSGDKVILDSTVTVTHNLSKLRRAMQESMKGADITVDSTDSAIVLKGSVASPAVAEKVERLAATFLRDKQSVVNMLDTRQGDQVMLKIKVAEVSRSELKRFGISLDSLLNVGNFVVGLASGHALATAVASGVGMLRNGSDNAVGVGYNSGSADINGVIDMLEDDGLVTVLAEPNLTAKSGVTASFLAGGEFPVPVSGENNAISIEYRPFGVSLNFTPVVLDERRISLTVSPEVSSISTANAVMANGFQIPSVVTRRASTTVEIGSGESFALAGLLRRSDMNDMSKVPGFGDVPVLGTLFRSSQYRQEQSELVIIATPYIVRPVSEAELATPIDGYVPATDMERILLGKMYHEEPMNDQQKRKSLIENVSVLDQPRPRLHGAAGFIIR